MKPEDSAPEKSEAAGDPLMADNRQAVGEDYSSADEEGPSFDCRVRRSYAERVVCGDARLALADRVLNQSYRTVLAAGVPSSWLRQEQDDWLAIRERAARYSTQAVEDVYAQRIDDLRAMTDEWTN